MTNSSPASKTSALVKLDAISVHISSQNILTEVSLNIFPEEIVTLIGPNGAGKTTLVRVVLGLVDDFSVSRTVKAGIKIGYMPQKLALNPQLPITVRRFLRISGASEQQLVHRMA